MAAKGLCRKIFLIKMPFLLLLQKMFQKLLDVRRVVKQEGVRHFEVWKFSVKHCIRKQTIALRFITREDDTNVLKILGAPIRVLHVSDDLQQNCNNGRHDADAQSFRGVHFDCARKHVVEAG